MNVDVIRAAVRNHPFRPFTIRLADGRSLEVNHPEVLATGNRIVIYVNPADDSTVWIEPLLIVSLDYSGQAPPPGSAPSNGNPPAGTLPGS